MIPCWWEERDTMKLLLNYYSLAAEKISYLRSPFLLAVRLYWGWQFVQTGWGKLHSLAKVTDFFTSLNIPFPALNAHFVAGLSSSAASCLSSACFHVPSRFCSRAPCLSPFGPLI